MAWLVLSRGGAWALMVDVLELIGLGSDAAAMATVAERLGGIAYTNHPGESEKRPYSGMIRVATDDIDSVAAVSDWSLLVGYSRVIKPYPATPSPDRVIAAFGLVRNPALSHREADDHWRDTHAPLALVNHAAMCDYTQLSTVATLSGQELDGVALCCFDNRDDMKAKFFNDDEARAVIEADVAKFANPGGSPRRVVLTQTVGGAAVS
jgi:hypothetical protein